MCFFPRLYLCLFCWVGILSFNPCLVLASPVETERSVTLQPSQFKKLNINTASPEALAEFLVGIGPKKAQAIVQHRTEQGPFKTLDDLLDVKGIGEVTLQKNRPLICVD
jgi:competence protein ComEA